MTWRGQSVEGRGVVVNSIDWMYQRSEDDDHSWSGTGPVPSSVVRRIDRDTMEWARLGLVRA